MFLTGYTPSPLFQGKESRLPKRSKPSKKPEQKSQFSLHTILEDTTPQRRTPVTQAMTPSGKATGVITDTRFNSTFSPDTLSARLADPGVVNARDARFRSAPPSLVPSRASSTSGTPYPPNTISPFVYSARSTAPTSYNGSAQPSGMQTPAN